MSLPGVIIIGWGLGGLWAAQALRRAPVEVTVCDRKIPHLSTPLLYQVATAGLSAPAIAGPIRHILADQKNATMLMATVSRIDAAKRVVVLDDQSELAYDYLIVAPGSVNHYFGHDDWAPYAPGLKTLQDALEIRARILTAYERAERETDPARRAARSCRPGPGGARSFAPRPSRGFHCRRSCRDRGRAGHRAGSEADGPPRGEECPAAAAGRRDAGLPLSRLRPARHHRPERRGRRVRQAEVLRLPGVAPVAARAHLLPHQFPQPPGGDDRLCVVVLDLPALRPHHHPRSHLGFLVPEPGRSAHAARIAVDVAQQPGRYVIGEHVARPQARHFAVQPRHVGHAAAQHDDVGVDEVDHAGERARQRLELAVERLAVEVGDFLGAALLAGEPLVVALERRAREVGFDAA